MSSRTVRRLRVDHVVRAMIDPLVVTREDATIEEVNQATLELLGYGPDELLGEPLSSIFPEPTGSGTRFSTVIRGSGVIRSERVAITRDGRQIPVSFSASLLRNESGTPIGLVAVAQDISALKQTEVALREAKERAEEANRLKSEFLANMSHELRTPLNAILGFARLLRKPESGLEDRARTFADRIHDNGRQLLALINDVLDLSKIESGRMETVVEAVQLDQLVGPAMERFGPQARLKGVELDEEVPPALTAVAADRRRLGQVLDILLSNGVKFTAAGRVLVSIQQDPVSRRPVALSVRDTGEGIPAEQLPVIFESFRQIDGRTTRRHAGTGLGLAIAHQLCEHMGLTLEVSSELGVGSEFVVRFPDRPIPLTGDAREPEPASSGIASLAGRLVLVIDDDPDARALVSALLEEIGCEVLLAASGGEGLAMARTRRPDAITLDLMMPGMTGWQFLERAASDPTIASIPVVVTSIVATDSRSSLPPSVVALDKPVSRAGLAAALATVVSG